LLGEKDSKQSSAGCDMSSRLHHHLVIIINHRHQTQLDSEAYYSSVHASIETAKVDGPSLAIVVRTNFNRMIQ
jgi:hypothetical protein